MRAGYPLIRHLLTVVALPVTIAILIPIWLARRYSVTFTFPADFAGAALGLIGTLLLMIGLALCASCLYQIATAARGRLAPWDPPDRLHLRGPYRFVRNPMVSGVILLLFGEALVLRSLPHVVWATAFLLLSLMYVPLLEEPQLEARFGDEYRRYRRLVPRFLPRLRPWNPHDQY